MKALGVPESTHVDIVAITNLWGYKVTVTWKTAQPIALRQAVAAGELSLAGMIGVAVLHGAPIPEDLKAWAAFIFAGKNGKAVESARAFIAAKGACNGTEGGS
jgi:hypothetical protein